LSGPARRRPLSLGVDSTRKELAKKPGNSIATYGRLQYIEAEKITVCVGTPLAVHKVCHITFGDDGIFVQSPYFHRTEGIASRVELGDGPPYHFKLDEHGKVTSNLVKLAHHVDGAVHFSQSGRVRTEIRRQSFRLDTSIGLLFDMFAFWLHGFVVVDSSEVRRQDRAWIQFQSRDDHVFGVNVKAEWRRKKAIEANIEPIKGTAGPHTTLTDRKTGGSFGAFFIGAPAASPLSSHCLVLSCQDSPFPDNVKEPMLLLVGGWDPAEVAADGPPVKQTGCLAALYPVGSPEELRARLGSIDLKPPGRA
jgi:hypothetical protein